MISKVPDTSMVDIHHVYSTASRSFEGEGSFPPTPPSNNQQSKALKTPLLHL